MFQIQEIVNSVYKSMTYIIYKEGCGNAWLVDIGDIDPVVAFLKGKQLTAEGVFLTHGHFDHIYGINNLSKNYPSCKVYATSYCKDCLYSDRLNMSRYHEQPITYEGDNVVLVKEGDMFKLFDDESPMQLYETPGHNPSCLTMVMDNVIFTGDAYIPGIGVNTQPYRANKGLAKQSLERILKLAEGKTVLPGHHV